MKTEKYRATERAPKTILVTGGSGFLGANLCLQLIRQGHHVICLDNNYTGRLENIQSILHHPNFTFVLHDVCLPFTWEGPIHQIYNLACPASPPAYQGTHAIDTTRTCVLGALNMLTLAQEKQATILQTSTSEVYGEPLVHPQSEKYRGNVNPIGIRSCYDEGKRCAESLFFDFARHRGVAIKVVRIFNTYGPLMDPNDGRVISNFICQALSGQEITLYGTGDQTRSFCYVDDLIDGLIRMMNSTPDFQGPVNLGNPGEFTMKALADMILDKIPTASRLVFCPLPSDDPTQRRPDITLAQSRLNWTPHIHLDQGLDKTIAYFKTQLSQFRSRHTAA